MSLPTQNYATGFKGKYLFLAAIISGAAGVARVKCPFALAGGIMAVVTFLRAPEVLGFFLGGGLYLTGRTLNLGLEQLFILNVGSFLFPMACLLLFLLLGKKAGAFSSVFRCGEFWAVLGLGVLMAARLPDSLFPEYGAQKVKYYLANNMVCFFGPLLATAIWGSPGLIRFLKGVFLGGLGLTAYFWLSRSYLDLPLNTYAVLNFNPIGLSRIIGLFALLAILGGMFPLPVLFRVFLASAAGAAMVILNARGPALALVVSLVIAGAGLTGRKFRLLPLLAAVLFSLLAVFIYSNYWFSPGFFTLDDTGRTPLYQAALDTFRQSPALGAGTGSFASISPDPRNAYPHNLFLETAAELGIAGLGLSLLLVFAPLSRLLCRRKSGGKEAALAGALLVFCLVNAMVSADIPGNFPLWLAAGVASSLSVAAKEERP